MSWHHRRTSRPARHAAMASAAAKPAADVPGRRPALCARRAGCVVAVKARDPTRDTELAISLLVERDLVEELRPRGRDVGAEERRLSSANGASEGVAGELSRDAHVEDLHERPTAGEADSEMGDLEEQPRKRPVAAEGEGELEHCEVVAVLPAWETEALLP